MQKGEAPASVQCAALRALGHVLGTIQSMPLSDAKIFNECGFAHADIPAFQIHSWADSNLSHRWRKGPCPVANHLHSQLCSDTWTAYPSSLMAARGRDVRRP